MKKSMKMAVLILLTCPLLLITSCKKAEKGETGPQGATGAQGATGNANVYAYKFNINLTSFIGPLSNNEYSYVFNPTSVMGNIFITENDAVLLYLFDHATGSTDYYNAMPFNDYFNTGTAFNHHYFEVGATGFANILSIKIRNSTGGAPYAPMSGILYYKMVVIKSSNKIKPTLPNDLSYASVKQYYKLTD